MSPALLCRDRDASRDASESSPVIRKKALERALKEAVLAEDYSLAGSLKRELQLLVESNTPAVTELDLLRIELKAAVNEERYKDAGTLHARVQELEKQQSPAAASGGGGSSSPANVDRRSLSSNSDTVTDGVRVRVTSFYIPAQSEPRLSQYFFAYRVRITNERDATVQVRSRHWLITDGQGRVEEVRGPGVIGEQPILNPGKSFEYTSGCPLRTTLGFMEGEYTVGLLNEESGEWDGVLEVVVGRFLLSTDSPTAA
ncbi:MAG: hypothetical protein WDW36_009121 [Sanguina aurantia]